MSWIVLKEDEVIYVWTIIIHWYWSGTGSWNLPLMIKAHACLTVSINIMTADDQAMLWFDIEHFIYPQQLQLPPWEVSVVIAMLSELLQPFTFLTRCAVNTRWWEIDIHDCYSLVKIAFAPICVCRNNRQIWRHNASTSRSHDVTDELWWGQNAR